MANLSFDFNKIKRTFFNVTLKDGKKLIVKMPMKKTFEKMTVIKDIDVDEMDPGDVIDTIGSLCAEILSNNMNKKKITTEYVVENYDIEEMKAFIEGYYEFVGGVKSDPN